MSEFVEWDRKTVISLIETYRNYDVLWDPKHINHKNKTARQTALKEIAHHLNIDKSEIERKFKNVSSHYLRELKRERESEIGGAPYKSKWFAYKSMEFMNQRPINHRGKGFDPRMCELLLTGEEEGSQNSDESTDQTTEQTPLYDYVPKRRRTQINDISTECFEEQSAVESASIRDDCSTFSEYIASKLRTMEKKTKAMVEFEINLIMFKADMGFYADKTYEEIGRLV